MAVKHAHKLMKAGPIWKCVLGCTFFVYFKQDYILLGRPIVCWTCGLEFPMDDEAKAMDMPQCPTCRNPEFDDFDEAANVIMQKNLK